MTHRLKNAPSWFQIRNAPKSAGGLVIAAWHKQEDSHELAFGAKDVEYIPPSPEFNRTYQDSHAGVIDQLLVEEITASEYDALVHIAAIPEIISDGYLHHLGRLKWIYERSSVLGFEQTTCVGTVYTKVILQNGGLFPDDPLPDLKFAT